MTSTTSSQDHGRGGSQFVRRWEPDSEPRAEFVLVHGIAEHSGRYQRAGSLLAAAGYAVTGFDLIGFGASGGRRGDIERWDEYFDQVEGFVEAALPGPVVLFGHSMGGLIALGYALAANRPRPDLLALSAPALGGGARWQRAVAPLAARLVPQLKVPNALRGEQLSRDPAVAEDYFADPLVFRSSTTRLGAALFAAMARAAEAVDRLDVPTLVLHGGADTIVPPSATVVLERNPLVDRRLYPSLRHELLNEPEGPEIVATIVDWVADRLDHVDDESPVV